jgi:hypothetical protein
MMTTKRFPEFDIRQAGSMDRIQIRVECFVRVKRGGRYWKVVVADEYIYQTYQEQFQRFAQDLQLFHARCKMTELFFQLPNERMREQMIEKRIFAECHSHLSNKEEDILRYGKVR